MENKQEIVGKCSECGGPVKEQYEVELGNFKECKNCGLRLFPNYGDVIDMKPNKINIPPYIPNEPYKFPTGPNWPYSPYYSPYTIPSTPTCPSYPFITYYYVSN